MKVSRIPGALAAGMDGDVSEWEECQGRAPDHPVRRMDLGSGFRAGRLADGRTILYLDDGFSLTAEVTSLDDGTLSGPSAEAVFGAFGGRRTHAPFDPAEYGRFAALTLYRDASVMEDGVSFVITDELEIDLGEPTEGALPRFPCTVTYVTRDGKVSLEASGEAVHLPNGPAVVADGFTLLFPTDLWRPPARLCTCPTARQWSATGSRCCSPRTCWHSGGSGRGTCGGRWTRPDGCRRRAASREGRRPPRRGGASWRPRCPG